MQQPSIQLTIRGLDSATKRALTQKAADLGLSLNRYLLFQLKRTAGTDSPQSRYEALREFMAGHRLSDADRAAFDKALAWSDATSIAKQRAEDDTRL